MSKLYLTTPLYYVNDKPHIGHAYTTILADVIARYHRIMGDEVYFLTGTDEHGQKVQDAASNRNVNPKIHVDEYVLRFKALWKKLYIEYDDFIRTTDVRHTERVKELLISLYEKDEIYLDEYEGLYSVSEERFVTEKEVEEGEFRQIKKLKEKNYFFRMSNYQQALIDHIEKNPNMTLHKIVRGRPLREEWKDMHIWAYPCIWEETSCRTAMEAMSSRTLMLTNSLGALPETCSDHAFMYPYIKDEIEHCYRFADEILKQGISQNMSEADGDLNNRIIN